MMIPVTKLNKHVASILQGSISRGLTGRSTVLIGEVLRNEYNYRLPEIEVVCFDSGRIGQNKYTKGRLNEVHQMRGTVVAIKI
jgi:hypothetical protein